MENIARSLAVVQAKTVRTAEALYFGWIPICRRGHQESLSDGPLLPAPLRAAPGPFVGSEDR